MKKVEMKIDRINTTNRMKIDASLPWRRRLRQQVSPAMNR